MTDHQRKADEVEHQLEEMQERSAKLEQQIDDTSEDWEHKKRDDNVPGAGGEPEPEPEPDKDEES